MSNLINNILTNENVATSNATTSSEQTVKDKPSLFDSLLTNAGTPEETKVTNLQEAVQRIEEADLSMKLALEVKNKALNAYKEIMRMQV